MAVTRIRVYPTCDIHLLLNGPNGLPTEYQLEVREFLNPGNILSNDVAKITFTHFNSSIVSVSPTGRITPVGAGETFFRIRYQDTDGSSIWTSEIVVRVRVHHQLDSFWIGNNQATLTKGKDDYAISVYGAFSDGTIGDISSHPYLRFSSTNTSKVVVNDVDDKGRLTGMDVTGATPVMVRVTYGTQTEEVPVFVVALLATRPILELLHGNGNENERRNILLVAEGFIAPQARLFRQIVTLLMDDLFKSRLHSPFYMLEDKFNVWVAFVPSPEEGVSLGDFILKTKDGPFGLASGIPPSWISVELIEPDSYTLDELLLHVGFPDRYIPSPTNRIQAETAWAPITATTDFNPAKVEDAVLEVWLALRHYYLLQAKDSLFGFMNDDRYGDRESLNVDPTATPDPLMNWYEPRHQGISMDPRRM